ATATATARLAREGGWLGAKVKDVSGPGEVSAAGLPGEVGVLVLDVPKASRAAKAGLKRSDVILKLDDKAIGSLDDLETATKAASTGKGFTLAVWRGQVEFAIPIEADRPR
ncbi:PDZ domain-containing protein, partial [Singulisphaera rosea]